MSLQTTMRNVARGASARRAETEDEDAEDRERDDARAEEDEDTAKRAEGDEEDGDDARAETDDEDESRAETEDEDAEGDEDEPEARRGARRATVRKRRGAGRKTYGLADAAQTVELCAIAGVSARRAHRFVKSKTPVAEVRRALTASDSGGSQPLDTAPAKTSPTAGWDDVIGKVNAAARVPGR